MAKKLVKVAVTGAAGSIAYSLLFRIANGELFGKDTRIDLRLLERPEGEKQLSGVCMELADCAYPLLNSIKAGSNPREIFKDVDYAILVGAKPRSPGMERSDLLKDNGKIFVEQGKALNEVANKNVKVLVVGNPCNTNCWIAMKNAPSIDPKNFTAMTRLDENRGISQLAEKAKVEVDNVTNMTIWGNHSATQVPDFTHARIKGKPVTETISDKNWLETTFIENVQKRGAAVLAARGLSSAASAANAIIDHIKALITPTPEGEWFSCAVYTGGTKYPVDKDLIFSLPCRSKGNGDYEIVENLTWNSFIKDKIAQTERELVDERKEVSHG